MEQGMHFVEYLDSEFRKSKENINKSDQFYRTASGYHIRVPIIPISDMPLERVMFLAHKAQRTSIIVCSINSNGIIPLYFSDYDIVMFLSKINSLYPTTWQFILRSLKAYIEGRCTLVKFNIGERCFSFNGIPYLKDMCECDWRGCSIPVNAMIAVLNLILEKETLDQRDDEHVSTAIKLLLASVFYSHSSSEEVRASISSKFIDILNEDGINSSGKDKVYIKKSEVHDSLWYNSI